MKNEAYLQDEIAGKYAFMLELFSVIFIKNAYWWKTGSKTRIWFKMRFFSQKC